MVSHAILLAGGLGTRLRPLTDDIPKPLIPVQGKPLIEHVLDVCRKFNILTATICVGYRGDMIRAVLGDGSRIGMKLEYSSEDTPLGTSGCLTRVQRPHQTFLLMNADNLFSADIRAAIQHHKNSGALATLLTTEVDDPTPYAAVAPSDQKAKHPHIKSFVFKPARGTAPSNRIYSGYAVLEPEVLDLIPPAPSSLENDVYPVLAARGVLASFHSTAPWFDSGTHESYTQVCQKWRLD